MMDTQPPGEFIINITWPNGDQDRRIVSEDFFENFMRSRDPFGDALLFESTGINLRLARTVYFERMRHEAVRGAFPSSALLNKSAIGWIYWMEREPEDRTMIVVYYPPCSGENGKIAKPARIQSVLYKKGDLYDMFKRFKNSGEDMWTYWVKLSQIAPVETRDA